VSAVARIDKRTKFLTKRLNQGEIAIIDHVDLDRVSAEALVSCGVSGVINVAPSISGRYPNLGPQILLDAGIPLLDDVGPEIFDRFKEGEAIRISDAVVYRGEEVLAKGIRHTAESIEALLVEAKAGLATQLESFVANTMEYVKREQDLLIDGVGVPDIETKIDGRHALIVVRGYHYREDIAALRPYIREYKPILIGVDGGADALLKAGYKPDMIVGDMDSVSDGALRCGAELMVHAYRDGEAPGAPRLERLGLRYSSVSAPGISEDIALLLAFEKGAELIVAVGTHFNLTEFLERDRAGMSSTFVTRLKVGEILIDAKGVSRLVSRQVGLWPLILFAAAGLGAVVVAIVASPGLRHFIGLLSQRIRDLLGLG
jgi:uncharacterized membrane-anchored protein